LLDGVIPSCLMPVTVQSFWRAGAFTARIRHRGDVQIASEIPREPLDLLVGPSDT